MRFALINPDWTFDGSIYFGCRKSHLSLEFGYAKALLEAAGHQAIILDGQLEGLSCWDMHSCLSFYRPDFTVVTTAPNYLAWACPPPELRIPMELVNDLRDVGGVMIAVGPHGSTTPKVALHKLGVDMVIRGEFEQVLPQIPGTSPEDWPRVPAACFDLNGETHVTGLPYAADMATLPALRWSRDLIARHYHHHNWFEAGVGGPGAEMEASRGCTFQCFFCAKENFRDEYRARPLPTVLNELDGLIEHGAHYVFFIDECFQPDEALIEALGQRKIKFGIQTRIDLWDEPMLKRLGRAGCVSLEVGIESITPEGRRQLGKESELTTEQMTERLIFARRQIEFVQAALLDNPLDDPLQVDAWRNRLHLHGVLASLPIPVFTYPGSLGYLQQWGQPDDQAWERAHEAFMAQYADHRHFRNMSPLPLTKLEMNYEHVY